MDASSKREKRQETKEGHEEFASTGNVADGLHVDWMQAEQESCQELCHGVPRRILSKDKAGSFGRQK
eukprot:scaffold39860_cov57-Attheya_sp.AAC.7